MKEILSKPPFEATILDPHEGVLVCLLRRLHMLDPHVKVFFSLLRRSHMIDPHEGIFATP